MQPREVDSCSLKRIGDAIGSVKKTLRRGLSLGYLSDMVFIGNASPVYGWVPSQMVDLDCFLFVPALKQRLGRWLEATRDELTAALEPSKIDFEIRIVDGPYKPAVPRLARPVIVAHLGIFSEETYCACSPLERWAWRKYQCEAEPARLRRLAPPQPTLNEFVHGRRGLIDRLSVLTVGRVPMLERTLPDLTLHTFFVDHHSAAYQECCFAFATNCARNHARALGCPEADRLGNESFFPWYGENIFSSKALAEIIILKTRARDEGFVHDTAHVHDLALKYLRALAADLS